MYIRKVKKSESKSQRKHIKITSLNWLCISVKLKNLKANHNANALEVMAKKVVYIRKVKKSESKSQLTSFSKLGLTRLCISVKLKNLKANHNLVKRVTRLVLVVYIRKVKKSESKSQLNVVVKLKNERLCISVKLKNLKANHNSTGAIMLRKPGCVYP